MISLLTTDSARSSYHKICHSTSLYFDVQFGHRSLSAVRIAFFSVVLLELIQLYQWRDYALLNSSEWIKNIILPFDLIIVVLIVLGWKTRTSCVAHFVLFKMVMMSTTYHYHFDYVIENASFIFIFAPGPTVWSLDSKLMEIKTESVMIPVWFVILLFLALELIYLDSLFYKFRSSLWLEGFSFWFSAAIPHFSTGLFPDFLEKRWIVQTLAFLSFATEACFPLILFKRLRRPVLALAIMLHLGIAIFFPIPFFGLGMCALLLIFVHWDTHHVRLRRENSFPKYNKYVGWTLCAILVFSQIGLILNRTSTFNNRFADNALNWNRKHAAKWMGLYDHGVYLDHHFQNSVPILRYSSHFDGNEFQIPSFNSDGYPDYPEITGRLWVTHLFDVRQEIAKDPPEFQAIAAYLKNYARLKKIHLRQYDIEYKDPGLQLAWDFLLDDEIEQRPWRLAGHVFVQPDGSIRFEWNEAFRRRMRWH